MADHVSAAFRVKRRKKVYLSRRGVSLTPYASPYTSPFSRGVEHGDACGYCVGPGFHFAAADLCGRFRTIAVCGVFRRSDAPTGQRCNLALDLV
jgi:hypothetical protein